MHSSLVTQILPANVATRHGGPAEMVPAPSSGDNPRGLPDMQCCSVREAASLLAKSPQHIYNLINTGRFPPAVRVGKSHAVSLRKLRDYIDSGGEPFTPTASARVSEATALRRLRAR